MADNIIREVKLKTLSPRQIDRFSYYVLLMKHFKDEYSIYTEPASVTMVIKDIYNSHEGLFILLLKQLLVIIKIIIDIKLEFFRRGFIM